VVLGGSDLNSLLSIKGPLINKIRELITAERNKETHLKKIFIYSYLSEPFQTEAAR